MNGSVSAKELLMTVIKEMIEESRKSAFKSEDQISGYISGRLSGHLDLGCSVEREIQTRCKYKRVKGRLQRDNDGKYGSIDMVVKSYDCVYVELEYPRGRGKEHDKFVNHLANDIEKLSSTAIDDGAIIVIFHYSEIPEMDQLMKEALIERGSVDIIIVDMPRKGKKVENSDDRIHRI